MWKPKMGRFVASVLPGCCICSAAWAEEHAKQILPHRAELAAGVYAAGFSYQYGNANCGWIALQHETLLVDLPRGTSIPDYLSEVIKTTGKPAKWLVLTNIWDDPAWGSTILYDRDNKRWYDSGQHHGPDRTVPLVESLVDHGVERVITSSTIRARLLAASQRLSKTVVEGLAGETAIGNSGREVTFISLDDVREQGPAAVHLPEDRVLFGGPLVFNGTRARLTGNDTSQWTSALGKLSRLGATRVVPGFGSWNGAVSLERFRDLLVSLRDQVSHGIAEGYGLEEIQQRIRIPFDLMFWSTHTQPRPADIAHVFGELTVPAAPFAGQTPTASDPRPRALVLIGDSPHPPAPIEDTLRQVFEATDIQPHFAVDVEALSAENLSKVDLFVILRDGRQVPRKGPGRPPLRVLNDPLHGEIRTWMRLEQEQALVEFVERGGSLLNLHNALGLYPPAGPYLKLVGGRYIGHGPYERFRVEVADPDHPITAGVSDFTTADEQHTPVLYDESKVHRILNSRMDNGTVVPAGWVREVGSGRVCHLAGGHPREPLVHPMYQRLLRQAVEWCLRRK